MIFAWLKLLTIGGALLFPIAHTYIEERVRRARMRRVRPPRVPSGQTRTVIGQVRALDTVRSPIGERTCVACYARFARTPEGLFRGTDRAELATATDFILETDDGPYLVRTGDVWVGDYGPETGTLAGAPEEGPIADVLRGAGLSDATPVYYRETIVLPLQWIRVRGVVREEVVSGDVASPTGYRGPATMRVISGGDGCLVIG